jgi:hypothetical protein
VSCFQRADIQRAPEWIGCGGGFQPLAGTKKPAFDFRNAGQKTVILNYAALGSVQADGGPGGKFNRQNSLLP